MSSLSYRLAVPLLAAAGIGFVVAPTARADALSEVRIVQVQLGPNGSFTEIGAPLVVRSFSNGAAQTDLEFLAVPLVVGPGQTLSWDFAYTVTLRADGLPFPGAPPLPPACVPLLFGPCASPLDGQSLAWAFFTIGDIDARRMSPFAEFSGALRFEQELREGNLFESGLVHLEAGSNSEFTGWNGGFSVGAMTLAAAIPEPATYAQMGVGLALLAGVFARRRSPRRRALSPSAASSSR